MPSLYGVWVLCLLNSLAKIIHSLNVPINVFKNKIHSVEEIAKEADETLFLKMKCKLHYPVSKPHSPSS